MKYLVALGLSAMLLLGIFGPSMDVDYWQKVLYKKERAKEKKKKEYKICFIIWIVLTVALFVFVTFFWEL